MDAERLAGAGEGCGALPDGNAGLQEEKRLLRREVLARRDALTAEEQVRARVLITERILGHQWYYRAERILAFVPFGSELDITELLEEALRQGKELYLPRICGRAPEVPCAGFPAAKAPGENPSVQGDISGQERERHPAREMRFFRVLHLSALDPGFHGILEPPEDAPCYRYEEASASAQPLRDMMLMPGAAFDPFRNRLGYGGGYYDRFLEGKETLRTHTIAVCHACQVVPSVPAGEWDVRPYQVISV